MIHHVSMLAGAACGTSPVARDGAKQATNTFVLLLMVFTFLSLLMATGCATGVTAKTPERFANHQGRYAKEGERIKADPIAYLKDLYARCNAMGQYRLLFYRQERLGLFSPKLGPLEEIRAAFRKTPFSVKFEWDDPERDFYESVYVDGQNNNKLVVRERHGFWNLPPQVRVVNITDPVIWGKAKNPVTNFGLAQVVHRTLLPFEDPEIAAQTTITYEGLVTLEPMNRPAHHLLIERPQMPGLRYTRQDFYIDTETQLPSGTDLWTPNGKLDARYRYTNVDTNIALTDDDFRLSKDHPKFSPATNPLHE